MDTSSGFEVIGKLAERIGRVLVAGRNETDDEASSPVLQDAPVLGGDVLLRIGK